MLDVSDLEDFAEGLSALVDGLDLLVDDLSRRDAAGEPVRVGDDRFGSSGLDGPAFLLLL